MGNAVSILIASNNNEDFQCILNSLNRQKGFNIIGVENDETNTIIKSERLKPDVLILDLLRSAIDGAELAPIIHRRSPDTAIIMICDKDENEYAGKALRAGILGYLLRNEDMNKILPAVKIVSMGGYFISASIIISFFRSTAFMGQFYGQENGQNNTLFSPAERSIVTDLARGYSDAEIAEHLNFSKGTIKNYLAAIKHKLKLKNRVQMVVFSLVNGLISLEQLDICKINRQFANNTIQ
jgi:DNA-binding NarL/FixJ family response regulator